MRASIRTDNEQLPALDDFLTDLRGHGFRIDIIIGKALMIHWKDWQDQNT